MAVKYSLMQRIKPGDSTAPRKFYAVSQNSGELTLRELANYISQISTVSSIDTLAVLESLLQVIPQNLANGQIIRLGDFGSFYLTISSEGADTEEDFSKSMIKKAKLNFRPGKLIKNSLKTMDFEKA